MQATDFLRIIKFGLLGFAGLFIDFSITYLLKEKALINKYIANAPGFTSAVISNFILISIGRLTLMEINQWPINFFFLALNRVYLELFNE